MQQLNEFTTSFLTSELLSIFEEHTSTLTIDAWNSNPVKEAIKFFPLSKNNQKIPEIIKKDKNFLKIFELRNNLIVLSVNDHESLIDKNIKIKIEEIINAPLKKAILSYYN